MSFTGIVCSCWLFSLFLHTPTMTRLVSACLCLSQTPTSSLDYILAPAYRYSCFCQPALVHCSYNFKSHTSTVIYSSDFLCVCVTDPALLSCTRHTDFHWAELVIELRCPFVCDIECSFFLGLSLALRSHDQIPASHWRSKVVPKSGGQK